MRQRKTKRKTRTKQINVRSRARHLYVRLVSMCDDLWHVSGSGPQPGGGTATSGSGGESTKTVQDASHQAMAVLGIALIAGGEEIGAQMAMRSFSHLVREWIVYVH